jgi:UDPglucose--hexose-1-phosphate uridylyltransferase
MENEIRKDYLLDRWVIISPKRSKRPHSDVQAPLPIKDSNCIFCPGNEYTNPKSVIQKPGANWYIRVFKNQFPALAKEGKFEQKIDRFMSSTTGYGSHYVLIDTQFHNLHPAKYNLLQWERWFDAVTDIFFMEMADENIKYVLAFKNHGPEAGASQPHPHSQIIATPVIPYLINEELTKARDYYELTGHCPYCDIIKMESKGSRVVFENDEVIAFCPYAPLQPYETWIFPKKHTPSIQMSHKTREELLKALGHLIETYYTGLSDPPFNFFLHTAYPRMEEPTAKSYHLHFEVFPRLEKDAGFELGAGMNITTMFPEESAKFLKQIFKR